MLPEPTTREGRAALAALLAEPARALLASDVDGTLAPIVARPEDARALPAAVDALAALSPALGTTAVLTGRPALTALELGDLARVPRVVVLGHYGLDRWEGGEHTSPQPDPRVAAARDRLPALPPGATVEEKGLSFVVHTRQAADPEGALAAVDGPLRALADELGLEVVDGSYAREVRPPGVDKGHALTSLVEERDAGSVLFLGDDDGDLPVLDAVAALRGRGVPGLVVCAAREGGSARLRAGADLVVDGVDGVVAFLAALAGAVGSG